MHENECLQTYLLEDKTKLFKKKGHKIYFSVRNYINSAEKNKQHPGFCSQKCM